MKERKMNEKGKFLLRLSMNEEKFFFMSQKKEVGKYCNKKKKLHVLCLFMFVTR